MSKEMINNLTALKALEEVDKDLAIQAISNPNLDGKELSELLESSLMGRVIYKDTKEPLKLSNEVVMAGLLNKLLQINSDAINNL